MPDKILRTDVISERQEINLYEYYASKVGEFGGTEINPIWNRLDLLRLELIQVVKPPRIDNVVTTDVDTDDIINTDADDSKNWLRSNRFKTTLTEIWSLELKAWFTQQLVTYTRNDTNYLHWQKQI